MALVSLDTMVMIWALRKRADPGQEYRLDEAEKLLLWIAKGRHRVLLAAHAVSEYLTGLDDAARLKELANLQRDFFIAPYDVPALAIAAKIQTDVDLKKAAKNTGIHYQCVKADVAIVASSIAAHAEYIISTDADFPSITGGRIIAKTMTDIAEELALAEAPPPPPVVVPEKPKREETKSLFSESPPDDGEGDAVNQPGGESAPGTTLESPSIAALSPPAIQSATAVQSPSDSASQQTKSRHRPCRVSGRPDFCNALLTHHQQWVEKFGHRRIVCFRILDGISHSLYRALGRKKRHADDGSRNGSEEIFSGHCRPRRGSDFDVGET